MCVDTIQMLKIIKGVFAIVNFPPNVCTRTFDVFDFLRESLYRKSRLVTQQLRNSQVLNFPKSIIVIHHIGTTIHC